MGKTTSLVRQSLRAGNFMFSIHAASRSEERLISREDIKEAGRTAHTLTPREDGSFKVVGLDLEEIETTVICRFLERPRLLIITLI
jgi:hypothetical protein